MTQLTILASYKTRLERTERSFSIFPFVGPLNRSGGAKCGWNGMKLFACNNGRRTKRLMPIYTVYKAEQIVL